MNPTLLRAQAIAARFFNSVRLRRKRAYVELFTGPDGRRTAAAEIVLADLLQFCRGAASAFDADPRVHALLEGRREVWLRITGHLNIAEADFVRLDPDKPQMEGDENE